MSLLNSDKKIYRQEAIKHRERMDVREEDIENAIRLFFEHINPNENSIVASYWPMNREFDTSELMYSLIEKGIQCCLPIVQKDTKELLFAHWHDGIDLDKGKFGTVQPKVDEDTKYLEPDVLIVPLLAFDRKGHRLGYGGGYYDTTLKALKSNKEIVSVGWAYAQQAVIFNLPAEEHDQILDFVITPKGVHSFS